MSSSGYESQAEPPNEAGLKSAIKRHPRVFAALCLLVLAAAAIVIYFLKRGSEGEEKEKVVVSVQVAKAERGPISATSTAIGTIFPRLQATVSSKIASQIKTIGIIKNMPVKQGQIIATLETRDLQAQRDQAQSALKEAELNLTGLSTGSIPQTTAQDEKAIRDARASLDNANATYERRKQLYAQGGISKKDVEASELAVKTAENDLRLAETTSTLHKAAINPNDRAVAESRVKQAQDKLAELNAMIGYSEIRAPFDGVITDQFKFQGDFVSPGDKVFNVGDISEVIVKAPFPDEIASRLKTGDTATVSPTDLPGQTIDGKVTLVSRSGDPASRSFEVWVTLPNKDGKLRPGGSASVSVASETIPDAVTVPTAAVTLDAATENTGSAMVVDSQSIAHEVKVKVGIKSADRIQILSGLKGGETIVVEGNYALPDKTKVEIGEAGAGSEETKPESGEDN